MRRLRARGGRLPAHPEATGLPPGPNKGLCHKLAGRGTGDGERSPSSPSPGSAVLMPKIVAMARREALRGCSFVALDEADRVPTTKIALLGAPSPLIVEGRCHSRLGRIASRDRGRMRRAKLRRAV